MAGGPLAGCGAADVESRDVAADAALSASTSCVALLLPLPSIDCTPPDGAARSVSASPPQLPVACAASDELCARDGSLCLEDTCARASTPPSYSIGEQSACDK